MHIHGGDIYSREVRYDFSANLNFLGMPPAVVEAACQGVRESDHYPDVECRRLRQAIAEKEGIPREMILCGNGAADLIFALMAAERPQTAVVCTPTFHEYTQALESVRCRIRRVALREEEDFAYSDRLLESLEADVDMLVLCNPNNPTGTILKRELLLGILDRCREHNIRLLLDECFLDFLDDPASAEAVSLLGDHPQLIILRAFTKLYAMAGLRLGYAMTADRELIRKIRRNCQPWNVSVPAQYAGVAALKETEYVSTFRRLLKIERVWMKAQLRGMGIRIYGSYANYIFFRSVPGLAEKLLEEGIAIRDCSNYAGLTEGFYRIAVRNRQENLILTEALRRNLL